MVHVPNGGWNLWGELTFPELDTWLQQRRLGGVSQSRWIFALNSEGLANNQIKKLLSTDLT
jgi:hypothetical protein